MYTLKGIVKRGRGKWVLKLEPYLFFPIENVDEIDFLPPKVGYFNVDLRVVKGKIKSVVIRKYFYPQKNVNNV